MTAADATRLAGEAYRTRLARGEAATPDDKTRLAQEGYESRLARDAAGGQPDSGEFFKVGEKIGGHYEVAAIHHGELGVVYGCFDHETKLPRALKTVRARHASDKQVLSLFESEATVWISLEKHPYIVRAYLVKLFKSLPYVITEYIRGPEGMEGDLRGWLGHPRLTLPVAVAMALQIAQGMQHAVRKLPNLVHRDLKPGNILVNGDGKAMVTDFGLVRAAQSDAGTPAYMSPEQWRVQTLDARSDIYAYGCILFEMFTAHRLFPAVTEHEWERAHLESAPATLTSVVPGLPGEIDQFVRSCLEKNPAGRPQSWDEIVIFFAEWYHRLTGKAVVLDFSSLALDAAELLAASYSLFNLKRYEEAIRTCDRALAIDQNIAAAWAIKGSLLYVLKRYEEALQAYDRLIAIDPNNAAMWNYKGNALCYLNRYEEAIQSYDRALALDPNDAFTLRARSLAADALRAAKQSVTINGNIDQNDAAAWVSKGAVFHALNRYAEAIQSYDRALALDANDAFALWGRKEAAEALKATKQSGETNENINQNVAEGWLRECLALHYLKRYEEEIQGCDRALAIDENNARAWMRKGHALRELKRYEEAFQAYDRSIAIDPNNTAAWNNKGNALSYLTRYEEAIQYYDRALALDANDVFALRGRKEAADALKAARQSEGITGSLDQNDAAAWYNKGVALRNLKRYAEAIQAYDRALAIDENNASVWNNKGYALHELNRYEEAIKSYDRALAINQNDAWAWNSKGNALHALNRYEEAIQSYDRVLALDPDHAAALQAKNSAADALKTERRPRFSWTRFWDK